MADQQSPSLFDILKSLPSTTATPESIMQERLKQEQVPPARGPASVPSGIPGAGLPAQTQMVGDFFNRMKK